MKIVGLTGGIGSGKTLVAKMFSGFGIPTYDSDLEAKFLMNSSKDLQNKIIKILGKKSYKNGELNRRYVAEKVFNDKELLSKLNAVVHPAVRKHFLEWAKNQESTYVIQETALIFENKAHENYDYIILVTAPKDIRIKRVMHRDSQTKAQVLARMGHQVDDEKKMPLSDFVINNVDREDTYENVFQIHKAILAD